MTTNKGKLQSMTRDIRNAILLVCVVGALIGVGSSTAAADAGSNFFVPRTVQPWYEVFGAGFGCVVHRANGKVEVRVTSRRSLRLARKLIDTRKRVGGSRLSYVRRVDESQALVHFLAAWQFASQSLAAQPVIASSGAAEWISSPTVPLSRDRCRTVVVSLYSYPGHEATAEEVAWANQVAAQYPSNILVDARTVSAAPVIPQ